MDKRTRLINQIVNGEYSMFLHIPGQYPTTSQESEAGFRLARASAFECWSEATLASYAQDIAEGMHDGRNFMTEKYARMDNLIPPINTSPLIHKIVAIEVNWQEGLRSKYPRFFKQGAGGSDFATYLRSELETYSDRTLQCYFQDVSRAQEEGRNLAGERYLKMIGRLGYKSIEDYERKLATEQAG